MGQTWQRHRALLVLLAGCWLFRLLLIAHGGQLYWPDEARYFRATTVLGLLGAGDLKGAMASVVSHPDHMFYTVVGIVPAALQWLVATIAGEDSLAYPSSALWVAVAVLALACVANVGLVHALALRLGASTGEAGLAALLMAASGSMLYYSRHFLPYDAALALALLGLYIGLGSTRATLRAFVSGALCGLAFLTYNGYWVVAATTAAVPVLRRPFAWPFLRRGIATGAGFVAPWLSLALASALVGSGSLLSSMERFSRRAETQGVFAEGWSLPWEYFWHAEHGLLIVWACGAVALCVSLSKRPPADRARGLTWLAAAAAIYLMLLLGSTAFHRFNVFGRLARQMTPFLCLVAASGLAPLLLPQRLPRRLFMAAAAALIAQAGDNFVRPLLVDFPADVRRAASSQYGKIDLDVTVDGNMQALDERGGLLLLRAYGTPPASRTSRYVLLNAGALWPIRTPRPVPTGRVVFALAHPLEFIPYQYEGFTPDERAILRSADIRMTFVDLAAAPDP